MTDELSGQLTSFQTTNVERLVNDTANFLANDTQRNVLQTAVEEMQKLGSALNTAQGLQDTPAQLLGEGAHQSSRWHDNMNKAQKPLYTVIVIIPWLILL